MSLETVAYAIAPDLRLELGFDDLVGSLRAIAEPTRLRLVALLGREELTVTEISRVIGQSQPRTSRQLRLLVDAGIFERAPEGAYVYYRLAEHSPAAELALSASLRAPPTTDAIDRRRPRCPLARAPGEDRGRHRLPLGARRRARGSARSLRR